MRNTGFMGKRSFRLGLALLAASCFIVARQDSAGCGTHAEKSVEQLSLHRQALRMRPRLTTLAQSIATPPAADIGDIAVLEDSGDVIVRSVAFNLDQTTIAFIPTSQAATLYRFETAVASYDGNAAAAGTVVAGMADDDSRRIAIPFSFPFYGQSYRELYLNSDGNLTFNEGDSATAERSLGRMVVGPPRIAPLFRDLDPTKAPSGITVLSEADRMVVSWVAVPEFSSSGSGSQNTFQIRLFSNGRIEFAYGGVGTTDAVVGISPGSNQGTTTAVSFRDGSSAEYGGTVAQRFADQAEVDVYTAALKFYETHEDAYDYLVFFNTAGVVAAQGALAYEMTVRNPYGTGYGDTQKDFGREFGSPRRLLSVMNMGPLSQFSTDPDARVLQRLSTGDTGMTLLGHEAGHLFLAFASVRDPLDPTRKQMLKSDGAHWSFNFNSEASLLEGNRIVDNGDGTFQTAGTVEGYSLLDQYLMGLLPPSAVPPTFVVLNSNWLSDSPPRRATTTITGTRRDVYIDELMRVEGLRTPDDTVAQRHFRFAFILIVPAGTTPSSDAIAKLEGYRSRFPSDYSRWTGGRASAETTLRRSVGLSISPAAGLIAGRIGSAALSIQGPASSDLSFSLERGPGASFSTTQSSITIPAGAASVSFSIAAIAPGVGELTVRPSDPQFETTYATVKVLPSSSGLRLSLVSGDDPAGRQSTFRVTDLSGAPYAGTAVSAAASGGAVSPTTATSDANGLLSFLWSPGAGEGQQLTLAAQGATPFVYEGVVNSASFVSGLSPGSFASVFGFNMAGGSTGTGLPPYPSQIGGVEVNLGGEKAGLHYASDRQLNFVAPLQLTPGVASLAVSAPTGSTVITRVPVVSAAPGIFFSGTNDGAILRNQNFLEIYCTGLGSGQPVTVILGGRRLAAAWSGPNVAYPGLDQVNVEIPAGLTGDQTVSIEVGGRTSNEVKVRI